MNRTPYGELVVVIDCGDLDRSARFWAAVLGYTADNNDGTYRSLYPRDSHGIEILLQRTADTKVAKNRLHLDLRTRDLNQEVDRVTGLGATLLTEAPVREYGWTWHVLSDLDGNEFCVLQPRTITGPADPRVPCVPRPAPGNAQPVFAGLLTVLVAFSSSAAVVLTGLRAVGATPAEAASGLLTLCLTVGFGMLWLTRRHRIPVTLGWSTPGAALLASTGMVRGGWPAAVGAFGTVGVLILLTGLWPRLGGLITAIPRPIAQAMLAGITLELCLEPVKGLASHPLEVAPVLLTWLVFLKLARKWAVPAAFAVTLVVVGIGIARDHTWHGTILPHLALTMPAWTTGGLLGIALPLYVVTMAGQNVPGVAVMTTYGYTVPWRETMTVTGIGTVAGALTGGQVVNLAAITAALSAAPDAGSDPRRRWIAAQTAGWAYLGMALLATVFTTFLAAAPADVVGAVAGLALLGTLANSLAGALQAPEGREAAAITFVVAASGLTIAGIGTAFWALAAGLGVRAVLTLKPPTRIHRTDLR